MPLLKSKLFKVIIFSFIIGSLWLLISIQNTLLKIKTVYENINSNEVFKYQTIEFSYQDTFPKQLANAIKIALKYSSLKNTINVDVEPHNPNFSRLDENHAKFLIQEMQKVFTVSHAQAWKIALNNTSYAIKVYYSKDTQWEIAIVSIGVQHYIDALCFSLKLAGHEFINLTNALELLKIIQAR